MKLHDIECNEIDSYIVDLVVTNRDWRLGHKLNQAERREVIKQLAGLLSDNQLAELLDMSEAAVLKTRKRAKA